MNAVMLSGTVVQEPNVRSTQKGTAVASFTVLTVRRFGKQMEFEGKDYISCVAWGNEAQKVGNFVKPGTAVEIKGRIGKRSFEQNGEKEWVTEVNVESLDVVGAQAPAPPKQFSNAGGFGSGGFNQQAPSVFSQFGNAEEEIPF